MDTNIKHPRECIMPVLLRTRDGRLRLGVNGDAPKGPGGQLQQLLLLGVSKNEPSQRLEHKHASGEGDGVDQGVRQDDQD